MISDVSISIQDFRHAVIAMIEEIADHGDHGWALDHGTSLLATLETISAAEASQPVTSRTATIAAQVNHTAVYIEAIANGPGVKVDWEASWTDVTTVSEAEWSALLTRVKDGVDRVRAFVDTFDGWNSDYVGGAIALIAHTAYHLGEIRTSVGVLQDRAA